MEQGKNKGSIAGRYAVVRPLGKGTGGAVLLARDTFSTNNNLVAIKILEPSAAEGVEGQMIMREFEILSHVHHPHLVQVLDFGKLDNNGLFLVEEFVEGFSLQDAHFNHDDEIQSIILAILSALAYLHEVGVVHRDIKPANIMVHALDDPLALPHAMLVDFGLSSNNPTNDRLWGGTAFFMAPEIRRREAATPRADLYSLGVSLFYLLCGVQPVPDTESEDYSVIPPHVLNTKISLPLSRFILILLRQVRNVDLKDGAEAFRHFYNDVASTQYRDLLNAGVDPLFSSRVYAQYQNRFLLEIIGRTARQVMQEQLTPFNHLITVVDNDPEMRRQVSIFVQNQYKQQKKRVVVLNPRTSKIDVTWQVAIMEILTTLANTYSDPQAKSYRSNLQILKLYDLFYGHHLFKRLGMLVPTHDGPPHFDNHVYLQWFTEVIEALPNSPNLINDTYLFVDDLNSLIIDNEQTVTCLFQLLQSLPSQTILATADETVDFVDDIEKGLKTIPATQFQPEDIKSFLHGVVDPLSVIPQNFEQAHQHADGDIRYVAQLPFELQLYGYAIQSQDASHLPSRRPYKGSDSLSQLLRRRIIDLSEVERKILEVVSLIETDVDWVVIRKILDDGEFSQEEFENGLRTLEMRMLLQTYITQSVRHVRRPDEEMRKVLMARLSPSRVRINQLRINKEFNKLEAQGRVTFRQIAVQVENQNDVRLASDAWYQTSIKELNQRHLEPTQLFEAHLAMIQSVRAMEKDISRFSIDEVALRRAQLAKSWMTFGQPRFAIQAIEIAWQTATNSKSDWLKYRICVLGLDFSLSTNNLKTFEVWEKRADTDLSRLKNSIEISVLKLRRDIQIGQFKRASEALTQMMEVVKHLKDDRLETELLSLLGFFKEETGENGPALEHYKTAIRMAKRKQTVPYALVSYIGYGRLQGKYGTIEQALPSLSIGVKQAMTQGRIELVAEAFYSIAGAYGRTGQTLSAQRYANHFDHLVDRMDDLEMKIKSDFLNVRISDLCGNITMNQETNLPRIFELGKQALSPESKNSWRLSLRREIVNIALLSAQFMNHKEFEHFFEDGVVLLNDESQNYKEIYNNH